jgi:phage head maturation protease
MTEKKYLQVELKREDDKITFVASDETLDRSGEVIPIESWDVKNFKRNPVLLVNHEYRVENIVGQAKNIRIKEKKLLFEPFFHEITELSKEVKRMVEEGILNTVSVGFMPHGPKKDGDMGTNELFEISFVPVPANPSAERLKAVIEKGIEGENKKSEIEAWVAKFYEEKEEIKEIENKEGRVLSGKNRELINNAVEILKTASATLADLLKATESNDGKSGEEKNQGRKPKVVYAGEDGKIKTNLSPIIRALQDVNRITNDSLRKIKKTN